MLSMESSFVYLMLVFTFRASTKLRYCSSVSYKFHCLSVLRSVESV